MDAATEELRRAHDGLVEVYAEVAVGYLDEAPVDRAVLDLFCRLVLAAGGARVLDVGCGTGHLTRHVADQGLDARGLDLSPGMVERARADHAGLSFEVGDVRDLPVADASLDGVLAWYSLMFLPEGARARAFAELGRVVRPGGHVAVAFKAGEGQHRRAGRSVGAGIGFDLWFLHPVEVVARLEAAGFVPVLTASRPAGPGESSPQGYVVARRA